MSIGKTIDRWKVALLDVSKRNRLLYFRPTRSTLTLVEPGPQEVFDRLLNRSNTSLVIADSDRLATLLDPSDAVLAVAASPAGDAPVPLPARRRGAGELRFDQKQPQLGRALLTLRQRARTALEEQGVNVLFIAAGFLKWVDPQDRSTPVESPLLLVPVRLVRDQVNQPYRLQLLDDVVEINPTLLHKLESGLGVRLPSLSSENGVKLSDYLDQVRETVSGIAGWGVEEKLVLSTFSFHKLAMVRDLEQHQGLIEEHSLTRALAGDLSALTPVPDDLPVPEKLDDLPLTDPVVVLDADASQQHAIAVALRGVNCVVYGPPGTGKSQTIANLIAACLYAGKSVLFVAEKRAALDVVFTRLQKLGLGDFCLDAYDADKDRVYERLKRTRALCGTGSTLPRGIPGHDDPALVGRRQTINSVVRSLHSPLGALKLTPFHVHGQLARLSMAPSLPCPLPSPVDCDPLQKQRLDALVEKLAAYASVIAEHENHPWYGSGDGIGGVGWEVEARAAFAKFIKDLEQLRGAIQAVAGHLRIPAPGCLAHAKLLLALSEHYPTLKRLRSDLAERYQRTDDLDLPALLGRFRVNYASFFGRLPLFSHYGRDLRLLRDRLRGERPIDYPAALADLRAALVVKLTRPFLDAIDGARAPAWTELAPVMGDVAELIASMSGRANVSDASAEALGRALSSLRSLLGACESGLRFLETIFPTLDLALIDIDALIDWLVVRRNRLPDLAKWQRFVKVRKECEEEGLKDFVGKVWQTARDGHPLDKEQITRGFARRFFELWLDGACGRLPVLGSFNGKHHDEVIASFRALDRQHVASTASRLRADLIQRLPRTTLNAAPVGSELAVLDRELSKQRRRMPVRRLFATVPKVLRELTPCVMMSPLAVAQAIDPRKLRFDVVIFDEASQLCTEDAAGSVLRGNQLIVAGDNKQLPPTAFFKSGVNDDDLGDGEDPDDAAMAALDTTTRVAPSSIDSADNVLDQCLAVNFPRLPLRFHYRSRDEALIAFSNMHFYDGDLVTFPSADRHPAGGVMLRRVEGEYGRGGSRTNAREAEAVADLVFQHFREQPERSLGVVALSVAQQQAILDALERRRYADQSLEPLFSEDRAEPFFVKNLENVQGDERDVMMLSVGYGRDASGRLTLSFGPLNGAYGPRRLNVAITRARQQMIIVSSIVAADLPADATNEGVRLLRRYLDYAERGVEALGRGPNEPVSPGAESPFEEAVGRALVNRGHSVHRQVGCSGYRIDLAIVDPQRPGRYLLGIECDGAMYHSSPTARERDRIRQEILEDLGWRLVRIWSYDWVRDQEGQIARLERALREDVAGGQSSPPPNPPDYGVPVSGGSTTGGPLPTSKGDSGGSGTPDRQPYPTDGLETTPYQRVKLGHPVRPFDGSAERHLEAAILKVVGHESPVHRETLVDRIREHWAMGGVGPARGRRITTAVTRLERGGQIVCRGEFLWKPDVSTDIARVPVRVPVEGEERRAIELIAPEEIAAAARQLLRAGRSMCIDDLIRNTAITLGYERTGTIVERCVNEAIALLVESGYAQRSEDTISFER